MSQEQDFETQDFLTRQQQSMGVPDTPGLFRRRRGEVSQEPDRWDGNVVAANFLDFAKKMSRGAQEEGEKGPSIVEAIAWALIDKKVNKQVIKDDPEKSPSVLFLKELEESVDYAVGRDQDLVPSIVGLMWNWWSHPVGNENLEERRLRQSLAAVPWRQRLNVVLNRMYQTASVNAEIVTDTLKPDGHLPPNPMRVLHGIETSEYRVQARQGLTNFNIPRVQGFEVREGELVIKKPGQIGDEIPIPIHRFGGADPDYHLFPGDPAWADLLRKIRRFFKKDYQPATGTLSIVPREMVGVWRRGQNIETATIVVDKPREFRRALKAQADRVYYRLARTGQPLRDPIRPANVLGSGFARVIPLLPEAASQPEQSVPEKPISKSSKSVPGRKDPIEVHKKMRETREKIARLKKLRERSSYLSGRRDSLAIQMVEIIEGAAEKGIIDPSTKKPREGCSYGRRYQKVVVQIRETSQEAKDVRRKIIMNRLSGFKLIRIKDSSV